MATINLRKVSKFTARGVSPSYVDYGGLLVLNQKCIRDQKINTAPARLTDKEKNIGSNKKLQKFDILINSTGVGTLGRVAQVKYDLDATVDSHITIFRPAEFVEGQNKKVNPLYIGYCVRNQEKFIESKGAGATGQTELSKDSILDDVWIYLPDLPTQTRIASVLSAYDDLIENDEKRIKVLEEMAQLLYTEWFVKFNFPNSPPREGWQAKPDGVVKYKDAGGKMVDSGTEYGLIPEGWEIVPIKKLADFMNGYPFKPKDLGDQGLPIIKIPELRSGILEKTPRNNGDGLSRKYIIQTGDILFSWSATLLVNIWNFGEALLNQHLFKVTPKAQNYKAYTFYVLVLLVEKIRKHVVGATMQHLRKDTVESAKVLLPSTYVLTAYETKASKILEQISLLYRKNQNLSKTRDLLIPQLVTGKRELKN